MQRNRKASKTMTNIKSTVKLSKEFDGGKNKLLLKSKPQEQETYLKLT